MFICFIAVSLLVCDTHKKTYDMHFQCNFATHTVKHQSLYPHHRHPTNDIMSYVIRLPISQE